MCIRDRNFRVSWRLKGDPELLNPDGYSYRWSPWYDSGSDQPIFNYWHGKFATGTPTANINGYKNYYTNETRHMFEINKHASATYRIYLPPGPHVVGYAVEACWEPPSVMPVIDPVTDFPITANQPEAYHFKMVVNNGEVITDCKNCCGVSMDCSELYIEHSQWGGISSNRVGAYWPDAGGDNGYLHDCEPEQEGRYAATIHLPSCKWGNGIHRIVAINYRSYWDLYHHDMVFTIFDIIVNDPTL